MVREAMRMNLHSHPSPVAEALKLLDNDPRAGLAGDELRS